MNTDTDTIVYFNFANYFINKMIIMLLGLYQKKDVCVTLKSHACAFYVTNNYLFWKY